jgi:probable phosphomutase (TIGR03848 family)
MPRRPAPPKPTLVLFVRHGTTPTTGSVLPGRAPGLHLADQGRAQAQAVAESVAALAKVQAVYASPLERAQETATPIAERLGLPLHPENGLLECDFGDWTGAKLSDLAKLPEWRTVQRWPSGWRFPGGESFVELQVRMEGIVEELRRRHPGETVVAVSHADPIKAVASSALGTPLDLFQRLVISPCSVTAIAYGEGGPTVVCLNARAAGLPELLGPPSPPRRRTRRAREDTAPGVAPSSPSGAGVLEAESAGADTAGNGQRPPAARARRRGAPQ